MPLLVNLRCWPSLRIIINGPIHKVLLPVRFVDHRIDWALLASQALDTWWWKVNRSRIPPDCICGALIANQLRFRDNAPAKFLMHDSLSVVNGCSMMCLLAAKFSMPGDVLFRGLPIYHRGALRADHVLVVLVPEKLSRHDSSGSIPDSRRLFHSCDILGASLLASFAAVGLFS